MNRAIRTKVAACGGELFAWYRTGEKSSDAYYSREARAAGEGIMVSYQREGRETQVHSVAEMIEQIRAAGCSPAKECAPHPAEYALLCGFLLRLVRVMESPAFWSYLDETYGVASRDLMPRMEGTQLLYTVACLTSGRLTHLIKVSINFETFEIQQTRLELHAA